MFKKKEERKPVDPNKVETIIGTGSKLTGNIYSEGSIRIEGEIEGEIETEGDVFVGESGKLNANIKGRNIVVAGEVMGNVDAESKLEIVPTGKLIGDITMSTLVIEDGATFKGKSEARNFKKERMQSKGINEQNEKK
ncbi:MAG: polymer-forming cytoskeletal protein [Halanaerobium sp.]|nr:polymer-forming cytoskeletal protein [Halanaerobium sp.]